MGTGSRQIIPTDRPVDYPSSEELAAQDMDIYVVKETPQSLYTPPIAPYLVATTAEAPSNSGVFDAATSRQQSTPSTQAVGYVSHPTTTSAPPTRNMPPPGPYGSYSTSSSSGPVSYGSGGSRGSGRYLNNYQAPVVILAGLTGSGKSTLISHLTKAKVTIGHDLSSCTTEIGTYPTTINGTTVQLIDTPGFDDTHRSDTDILRTIAVMLAMLYQEQIPLLGVVYLHRISDSRVGGSSRRSLRILEAMCGQGAYHGILLATTMWDKVSSVAEGEQRELELKTNPSFFGTMCAGGATVIRHAGDKTSAEAIITRLFEKNSPHPMVFQLQRELVDDNLDLEETTAGRIVDAGLHQLQQRAQEEIAELEQALAEAKDESTIALLREEHRAQLNQQHQLSEARAGLRGNWTQHIDQLFQLPAGEEISVANDHSLAQNIALREEIELLKNRIEDTLTMNEINILQVKNEHRTERIRNTEKRTALQRELEEKTAQLARSERRAREEREAAHQHRRRNRFREFFSDLFTMEVVGYQEESYRYY